MKPDTWYRVPFANSKPGQLGRFDSAIATFRRALELGLNLADIHLRLDKMDHVLGERANAGRRGC